MNLAKFVTFRGINTLVTMMLSVAVGYEVYQLTDSALWLGFIGLVQFFPKILFMFYSGLIADKYDRQKILIFSQVGLFAISMTFGITSFTHTLTPVLALVLVFAYGTVFALEGPSTVAILPNLVSAEYFPKATATVSSVNEFATILGPAIAGFIYVIGPWADYWTISAANLILIGVALSLKLHHKTAEEKSNIPESPLAGFRYIWKNKGIFGALTLDMFAVLFGSVTAILPIFADKILKVGPVGFGFLRAAPSLGAILMAIFLIRRPIQNHTGKIMFAAVTVFGLTTIIFSLSRNIFLSIGVLAMLGAADMLSVVIRQTYVQMKTPDEVRGRVSAVNLIFVGASNQLGEFESGTLAAFSGAVPAGVIGGCLTLVVVAVCYFTFDDLRTLEKI
ncbi:MAG: MFS transporter [Lactobacillales bacterium]|nr:MFS transporter [Lactobacillales bacterium]